MGFIMASNSKAVAIVKRLRAAGYESFFAGGCVRDMLLGKIAKDIDIATAAKPDDIRQLFSETIPVGAQFGVMLVIMEGEPFEVATFRHDGPYLDGRHPSEVRFGSLEEDVRRRAGYHHGRYTTLRERVIELVDGNNLSVSRYAPSACPGALRVGPAAA